MLLSGDNLVCPCMIMLGCMAKSHCLPHIVFPFLVQTMMGLQPSPVEEKSYFLGRGESEMTLMWSLTWEECRMCPSFGWDRVNFLHNDCYDACDL